MVFKNAGFASLKIDFPRDFGIPPPCRGEPGLTCLRALGLLRQAVDTKVPGAFTRPARVPPDIHFRQCLCGSNYDRRPNTPSSKGVVLPDGVQTRGPTALYSSLP